MKPLKLVARQTTQRRMADIPTLNATRTPPTVPTPPDSPTSSWSISAFNKWSVGARLTVLIFAFVSVILLALIEMINYSISNEIRSQVTTDLVERTKLVVGTFNAVDQEMHKRVSAQSDLFRAYLNAPIEVSADREVDTGGVPAPVVSAGKLEFNGNYTLLDDFSQHSGGPVTVFARRGNEYLRVSSTLKTEDGHRVVGTALDHSNPAYAAINEGKSFTGPVTLFGQQIMAKYDPIVDTSGKVVGMTMVGVDFTASLKQMKDQIRAMKIGKTGYFYALDANEGAAYGNLVLHPTKEGQSILAAKDSDGHEFIRDIMTRKEGTSQYPWINAERGESQARIKAVAFAPMKAWNWIVVGGTYEDEFTETSNAMAHRYQIIGVLLLLMMGAGLYFIMRSRLSVPLSQATLAAKSLAQGDLTVNVQSDRVDEIGQLIEAINGIGTGLRKVVETVHDSAEQLARSSEEISIGNLDLSSRTESQASSLEETSASMQELTGTVRQNAESAVQANQLVQSASGIATRGGVAMDQVIDTMDNIKDSSRRIVDIIAVIDGIAFQTNILALNAAVEAARAGEQGRGFAVVATEVRNLAQRSAAAAQEIKQLITDSVGKIDSGHDLAQQAGDTMKELLEAVGKVTAIMADISSASKDQSVGLDHINHAVTDMEQMTQQNAALVEEAAAATQAMHDLAASLVEEVDQFKLH